MNGSPRHGTRQQVRAVILDAGGVILYPDLDWIARRSAEQDVRVDRQALFEAYYRTIHELDLNPFMAPHGPSFNGLQIRIWFFDRMLRHAGAPADQVEAVGRSIAEQALASFPKESDIYHWAMPDIERKLRRLQEAGFVLGCASNNDGALEDQLTSVGVVHLFSTLKDSEKEGVAKPDPELLLRAARDLQVPPEHCVYIGDVDRIDGQAARAAGMAFALLDPLCQERPQNPRCIRDLDRIQDHFAAFSAH
jgi:HAD superfamily hydrolase (TIGR01549 family)